MANKIQAEMWDKLHYLFRGFNDRTIHVEIDYDFELDTDVLKKFVSNLYERVPLMHSTFIDNRIRPYWIVNPYNIDDAFTIKNINEAEKEEVVEEFLMQEVSYSDKLQFRVGVFYYSGQTALCIVTNHMCMDGGGIKYLTNKLCHDYNYYVEHGEMPNDIINGTRSYTAVYRDMSEEDKKIANGLFRNPSVHDKHKFPLTESKSGDKSFMPKYKINHEMFVTLKTLGKQNGYTLNDVLLASYFESVYRLAKFNKKDSLTIACAIDLRRYIKDPMSIGLTNHTAWMQCNIPSLGKDIFETLKFVSESTNKYKKDRFMGLYGLPLLNFGYKAFPHFISEIAIKIGYSNPHIAMSNIGIMEPDKLALCGHEPTYGFMSGAVKYKPFVLLSAITFREEITLAIGTRGNEKDREVIEHFYKIYEECLNEIVEGWKK